MENIEELFQMLSGEKKSLKPEHAYKAAEEGLLRAFYFFRWLNKKDYKTLDNVVEAFRKNKVPEQQVEHYGSALVMIDYYETDERVKNALRYINDQYKEKVGDDIIYSMKDQRIERRILKNIYKIYLDSLDRLKNRTKTLKKSSFTVWILIFVFLAANIILVATGTYYNLLMKIVPDLMTDSKLMEKYGVAVAAGILFVIPALLILIVARHKLSEHTSKGGEYPEVIQKLEEGAEAFRLRLKEKKINVDRNEEGSGNGQ